MNVDQWLLVLNYWSYLRKDYGPFTVLGQQSILAKGNFLQKKCLEMLLIPIQTFFKGFTTKVKFYQYFMRGSRVWKPDELFVLIRCVLFIKSPPIKVSLSLSLCLSLCLSLSLSVSLSVYLSLSLCLSVSLSLSLCLSLSLSLSLYLCVSLFVCLFVSLFLSLFLCLSLSLSISLEGNSSTFKWLLETLLLAIKMCTGFTTDAKWLNTKVYHVTSEPTKSSSRWISPFKDWSMLLNNWVVNFTKVKSF